MLEHHKLALVQQLKFLSHFILKKVQLQASVLKQLLLLVMFQFESLTLQLMHFQSALTFFTKQNHESLLLLTLLLELHHV